MFVNLRVVDGSISIHALLAESDSTTIITICIAPRFLSTLSLRRATPPSITPAASRRNFYPRSPCGERPYDGLIASANFCISIHALLAESDNRYGRPIDVQLVFLSTLSLRRATISCITAEMVKTSFLSTLSLRRATESRSNILKTSQYFYPRSPCGERLSDLLIVTVALDDFYPRSPCGERQIQDAGAHLHILISIHALLAESD